MIFLIGLTIYFLTKKDFTKEYQTVFSCVNKREKVSVNVRFESKYLNKTYDDDNFMDERRGSDFTIIIEENNNEGSNEEVIFAGDSIGEALDSFEKTKKMFLGNGFKCH